MKATITPADEGGWLLTYENGNKYLIWVNDNGAYTAARIIHQNPLEALDEALDKCFVDVGKMEVSK